MRHYYPTNNYFDKILMNQLYKFSYLKVGIFGIFADNRYNTHQHIAGKLLIYMFYNLWDMVNKNYPLAKTHQNSQYIFLKRYISCIWVDMGDIHIR